MKIKFTKMQGLGNDFVVIDAINQKVDLSQEQIKHLADRHYGVGCDQVLLVENPRSEQEDFFYRIFNLDASEVGQCGNGVRCLAKFVYETGLTKKTNLRIATKKVLMQTSLNENGLVKVDMGKPIFNAADIPLAKENNHEPVLINWKNEKWYFNVLSVGNPHAVTWVNKFNDVLVQEFGEFVSKHEIFPQQTNVEFIKKISNEHVYMRVYERGAGETLACGSGACAAVVAGILHQQLANKVTVTLLGGDLQIEWYGSETSVWMTGPAEIIFTGEIKI